MYGYQGNNSQPYNYQNPPGPSYSNIGQYTGPYHSYYSNASTAYNSFPSNDQPCSSLGVLPQEYSQVGNGIPRPYYFDSNSSYPRPYQALPYNQSVDLPIANSYNTCPRNCHCCESINQKYFATNNSLQQQSNTQNICDSSLNASYNGFRKGLSSGRWREGSQIPNIPETNDSTAAWPIPKYGTNCKTEPCMWPLPQKQPTKFENTEHLNTGNTYILPQQHQRKPIASNQTYSVIHSNSILPVQTSRPPQGRSDELIANCFTPYPCTSEYKKNIAEHTPYPKSHINKAPLPSRSTCNLSSNCEGGFSYKFSPANSNIYHENQKCAIDSPKLVSQLSNTLVESIQRRLPGSNVLDGTNDISYCQSGLITSVHSIDAPTRRAYSIPTEGDPRILLNCGSSVSNDVLPTSRLSLPPIHSLKPTMSGPPKDFCDEFSYNPLRSSEKSNLDDGYRIPSARNLAMSNVSVRTLNPINHEKVPDISSENSCRIELEMENSYSVANFIPNNRHGGKQFYPEPPSEFSETDTKHKIRKDMHVKPLRSMSGNPVIGDLRHFLSTWDDADDEESNSVAPCVLPLGNECPQEQLGREPVLQGECALVGHLQEKADNVCTDEHGSSSNCVVEPKELPVAYERANSYKVFNGSSETDSFNVHADSIVSATNTVVGYLGIPPKTCGELEPCAEKTVLIPKINTLNPDAGETPQETYNQLGLSPQSNSNPYDIVTNISEKKECRSSSCEENLNIPAISVEEPSTSPNGRENGVNSEIPSTTSHVVPSGVLNGTSTKEKEGDALQQHSLDGIVGHTEESCSIRNVGRKISCSEDSESPSKICTGTSEDNLVSEAVGRTVISSSSPRSPKAIYSPNDALNCDPSPEFYLPSDKPEYSSFIWPSSKSKECVFDPKDDIVENNPKMFQDKQVAINEVESGHDVDGETAASQDLRADTCNDDCIQNGKCGSGIKESTLKDISCNGDVAEHVSVPVVKMNSFLLPENNSKNPPEQVLPATRENSFVSSKEVASSHQEITAQDELNRETGVSPQRITFDGIFNPFEGHQERSILNSVQSTEDPLFNMEIEGRDGDNGKSSLNQDGGISSKSIWLKNKLKFKESRMKASKRVTKKSSYFAVLQIGRKYMRLKNQKRLSLAERRNELRNAIKSTGMIERTKNVHLMEKKPVKNHFESLSCKRDSPNDISLKESQIINIEVKKEPEREPACVAGGYDKNGDILEDVHQLKNTDNELQKTCSILSGEIRLLGEGDAVAYPESETVDEIPSDENTIEEFLCVEEGESHLVNFEGNCVIGNVEVFMGTVEDANSFEEAIEGADMENVLREEPLIPEEANNMQYWCNYELGNDLGVAMEIEVGSEIYSSDNVESKQQVEEDILSCKGMNDRVGCIGLEKEVPDCQEREKIPVNPSIDLSDAKIIDEQTTGNKDHSSEKLFDNKDPCICEKKQEKNEKGALNINNSIACSQNENYPEEVSVTHRSVIKDVNKSMDNINNNCDEAVSQYFQEHKDMGDIPFPECHSASAMNEDMMSGASQTQNSEKEACGQESKEYILSAKSTSKEVSLKTKEHKPFHKRLKKCIKNMINSACNLNEGDLARSHSNWYSSIELPTEKNRMINAVSSDDIHSEDDAISAPLPPQVSESISEESKGIITVKKDIVHKDGGVSHINAVEMNGCDCSGRLDPLLIHGSCKNKLSTVGNQNQRKTESRNEDQTSLSNSSNEHFGGASDKMAKKQSIKLKFIYKSSRVIDPIKEHEVIDHQPEPFNKKPLLKTKASLKSFENLQLKNVISPKFGFWKNRSWHHRRIFHRHLKKSSLQQNVSSIPPQVMPQSPKHRLPQILEICSVPPPEPLSPLPVSEDTPNTACENISVEASHPACKMKYLDKNANENTVFPSNYAFLGFRDHSDDSATLNQPVVDPEFSSIHENGNVSQAAPEMNCILADSVHSKSLPAIPVEQYNGKEIPTEEATKSMGQNEEDAATDSVFLDACPAKDTIPGETRVDSNWSAVNSSLNVVNSSSGASPHVRMSFKKVLNGSKKNVWMKRPIADSPMENQDIFLPRKSKQTKRMSSTEGESPLPKVTIKKKSGEKGYQSFLSGFSSASSSPSTSPTFLSKSSSPLHLLPNTIKPSMPSPEESAMNVEPTKEFHALLEPTGVSNSNSVVDVEMSAKNSSVDHALYTNVVKKKEGSGLVFVIRGLGGKIKGCSVKDKDEENKQPTPAEECVPNNSNVQDTSLSTCTTGAGDDDWELGPWSVWQPVVKLSRSSELDHLALKLNSVQEDDEGKNACGKLPDFQETPRIEDCPNVCRDFVVSNHMHRHSQDDSKELDKKGKVPNETDSCQNQSGEIKQNKKVAHINFSSSKLEFDMVMKECDRLIMPKKKPKSGNKFQSAHVSAAVKNIQVLRTAGCDVKGKVLRESGTPEQVDNKSSTKNAPLVEDQVKIECASESMADSSILSKGTPSDDKIKNSGERAWENGGKRGSCNEGDDPGTKAKRKIGGEGVASEVESAVKLENSKILSSPEMKSLKVPQISVPDKQQEVRVKEKVLQGNFGPNGSPSLVQQPIKEIVQSKPLKCEKESHARPNDRSPYVCEACCRAFSSQKWLSRHCKGVSHSRVENAQRQAVQALLLLLTGKESHLLQPLTEKEFSHLKRWSSHAVPSPLQLALNDFLNTT
ncbi:uncharacterized protein [Hetaerina americana]|uniref:uncharacterized protein n=1 Tax=Hetaerina americana TaxID=62018 RepID=UPI003A7F6255